MSLTNLSLAGDVYKCTVDGVSTFSQMPCGDEAVRIEVENKSGINSTVKPMIASSRTTAPSKHRENTSVFLLDQEIERNTLSISRYERKMTKELRVLKARTYNATNSLAGAVYHQALAEEMTVVTAKYNSLIDGLNEQNAKLAAKRDSY